jgi:putative endonuclease
LIRGASFEAPLSYFRANLDLAYHVQPAGPPKRESVLMHYVYILYSPSVQRFYIGSTSNLPQRLHYHNTGRSPYTKGKGPWHLVYSEECATKEQALHRERELKNWKSPKRLVESFSIDLSSLGSSGPVVTG